MCVSIWYIVEIVFHRGNGNGKDRSPFVSEAVSSFNVSCKNQGRCPFYPAPSPGFSWIACPLSESLPAMPVYIIPINIHVHPNNNMA
jgi:hypothetical protein